MSVNIINNFWVLFAAFLVFLMTIAVGFLEVGELGEQLKRSLYKTILITGIAFIVMAAIGFNTAFAPTIYGIIGNPFYSPGLFLGSIGSSTSIFSQVWWSTASSYFDTGLLGITYFMFETAFASVTLALVSVIVLRKMKMSSFVAFSIVYFVIIYNLPAAWIWNPTGWLYRIGMRDFAGGLVVHGAAGFAGLALMVRIWQEERRNGLKESAREKMQINDTMLTLSILLLMMGWFGFNPGSVLAFSYDTLIVVATTFIAAFAAMLSTLASSYFVNGETGGIINAVNGILMGLIVITPLAGFVSPFSALILGIIAGPIFVYAERYFSRFKWFSDPVGLMPGHFTGGLFGVIMIAFFTQHSYALLSGNGNLPNGIFFGGGIAAVHQLGIEVLGIMAVAAFVFTVSYLTIYLISRVSGGILCNKNDFASRYYSKIPATERK
ncbi:ammonium transporter [Thermoplasma sp.]|uniref:ammonium transporter n=1 Tax=Thermoplasma sp. TaxID=1973142 RepID=UPI0012811E4D|nr:ammonium transporter [Thermoplasma sp.]KAA8922625.1 MAG: ammonium transporter [Thermoplasma sp.]